MQILAVSEINKLLTVIPAAFEPLAAGAGARLAGRARGPVVLVVVVVAVAVVVGRGEAARAARRSLAACRGRLRRRRHVADA